MIVRPLFCSIALLPITALYFYHVTTKAYEYTLDSSAWMSNGRQLLLRFTERWVLCKTDGVIVHSFHKITFPFSHFSNHKWGTRFCLHFDELIAPIISLVIFIMTLQTAAIYYSEILRYYVTKTMKDTRYHFASRIACDIPKLVQK